MFRVHDLSVQNSAVANYLYELRNVETQADRHRFRENVKRVGRALGYEISKKLLYKEVSVKTPLDNHRQSLLKDEVVVITILRAGLPLHEGILDVFPSAENGFVSAYRKHDRDGSFKIESKYVACPDLSGKVLIINDPMLATGSSFEAAFQALQPYGNPRSIHLVSVVGSAAGVKRIASQQLDGDLWIGAIDPGLSDDKYIVPGLGDAGDLSFGSKLQR